MLIGYARVSTQNQNLDRRLGALRVARCKQIFTEKATGKTVKGRPELEKAIDALGAGDVLVLAEWDRATRSMIDGIAIMQRVAARGATIKVLDKPHLDLTSKIGQGILAFLSALADDERERIVKRAADGRRAAKDKGVVMGRPPALRNIRHRKRGGGLPRVKAAAQSPKASIVTIVRFQGARSEESMSIAWLGGKPHSVANSKAPVLGY